MIIFRRVLKLCKPEKQAMTQFQKRILKITQLCKHHLKTKYYRLKKRIQSMTAQRILHLMNAVLK